MLAAPGKAGQEIGLLVGTAGQPEDYVDHIATTNIQMRFRHVHRSIVDALTSLLGK